MLNLGNYDIYRKSHTVEELNKTSLFDRIDESNKAFDYLIEKGYNNWILTFSGGKDSTTILVLALEYIIDNPGRVDRVDVVYADTLVEIPSITEFAKSILTFLKRFKKEKQLNLYTHVTKPEMYSRFWVKILGFGYPPPHQTFRWCTKRLKIEPVEQKLKRYFKKDRTAIITGVRY